MAISLVLPQQSVPGSGSWPKIRHQLGYLLCKLSGLGCVFVELGIRPLVIVPILICSAATTNLNALPPKVVNPQPLVTLRDGFVRILLTRHSASFVSIDRILPMTTSESLDLVRIGVRFIHRSLQVRVRQQRVV